MIRHPKIEGRGFGGSCIRCVMMMMVVCGAVWANVNHAGASTMNLIATQDTWTPTAKADTTTHDNDGIRILEGTSSTAQGGWLQFNLAQLPANATIISAHLDLYLVGATSSTTNNIAIDGSTQSNAAGTITIDDSTFNRVTYSNGGDFNTPLGNNEVNGTLGDFAAGVLGNSGAMPTLNQFYSSSDANAGDLTLLQSIYGAGGSLVLQLYGPNITGTHTRTFEDHEGSLTGNTDNAPRLVVNYSVPEPSTFVLSGMGLAGLACVRMRNRRLATR